MSAGLEDVKIDEDKEENDDLNETPKPVKRKKTIHSIADHDSISLDYDADENHEHSDELDDQLDEMIVVNFFKFIIQISIHIFF